MHTAARLPSSEDRIYGQIRSPGLRGAAGDFHPQLWSVNLAMSSIATEQCIGLVARLSGGSALHVGGLFTLYRRAYGLTSYTVMNPPPAEVPYRLPFTSIKSPFGFPWEVYSCCVQKE